MEGPPFFQFASKTPACLSRATHPNTVLGGTAGLLGTRSGMPFTVASHPVLSSQQSPLWCLQRCWRWPRASSQSAGLISDTQVHDRPILWCRSTSSYPPDTIQLLIPPQHAPNSCCTRTPLMHIPLA